MINFKIKNTICLGKKSDSSLNLNDHEQNQNDKIEVLVNLFADLRDQIDDLNRKLKASEDKAMSLENKIAELKTEKEIEKSRTNALNSTFLEKFQKLETSLSFLNLSDQSQTHQVAQLTNKHNILSSTSYVFIFLADKVFLN